MRTKQEVPKLIRYYGNEEIIDAFLQASEAIQKTILRYLRAVWDDDNENRVQVRLELRKMLGIK